MNREPDAEGEGKLARLSQILAVLGLPVVGKGGWEAKEIRLGPIRKSQTPRSAFQRRISTSPRKFARKISRTFGAS